MRRLKPLLLFGFVVLGIVLASTRFFALQSAFSLSEAFKPEDPFYSVIYVVEEGDTWSVIAEKVDIAPEMSMKLLSVSEGAHSLADLRAGNPIDFHYDKETHALVGLKYDISEDEMLLIEERAIDETTTELVARVEEIQYKVTPVVRGGTISSSLFETAIEAGVPESVILNMAWIFSWDIDFNTAIREGDSFVVAWEERTRDGVPVKPGRVLAAQFVNDGEEYFALYYIDPDGGGQYRNADGDELKRQFLRAPLDYRRISSGFSTSRYVEVLEYFGSHRAIDYVSPTGTPISATADGTVTFIGWNGDHGRHIRIKHGNGYSTGYSHLSAYAKGMGVGVKVKQNQVIGFVGSSGLTTGPHLHYEMRKNGTLINPLSLDLPPGKPLKDEHRADFEEAKRKLLALLSASRDGM